MSEWVQSSVSGRSDLNFAPNLHTKNPQRFQKPIFGSKFMINAQQQKRGEPSRGTAAIAAVAFNYPDCQGSL
jgi:hypothetical protein